jgi:glycosyltransferase involved in cell wall biosynthesis
MYDFDKPDIILCAWPTADIANAAIKYGNKHHIPVVLDARDMWPDIFERAFPPWIKPLGRIALMPSKQKAKRLFSAAKGITGVNDHMVRWACSYANRTPKDSDKVIYIGDNYIDDSDLNDSELLEKYSVSNNSWNICYIGSLRNSGLDLDTCISAVKKLEKKYSNINLIIAGEGDSKTYLQSIAGESDNIKFVGWLNRKQMNQVMRASKVGLYCIKNTPDFVDTFSNKAVQYLSAGLPVMSSLNGFSRQLLKDNAAGIHYEEGNIDNCAKVIETLYLDDCYRNQLARGAFALFEKDFESSKVNQAFMEYLQKIIDENH